MRERAILDKGRSDAETEALLATGTINLTAVLAVGAAPPSDSPRHKAITHLCWQVLHRAAETVRSNFGFYIEHCHGAGISCADCLTLVYEPDPLDPLRASGLDGWSASLGRTDDTVADTAAAVPARCRAEAMFGYTRGPNCSSGTL